jgi:hypothetical protein
MIQYILWQKAPHNKERTLWHYSTKTEGGLLFVIRCDEETYLIWKWRPRHAGMAAGAEVNGTKKENAIRWGSSPRVKDGEVAVFVYKQKRRRDAGLYRRPL